MMSVSPRSSREPQNHAASGVWANVEVVGRLHDDVPRDKRLYDGYTRLAVQQNLWLSMAVIAALIVATTTGVFGIGPAIFVHEGSTLVVIANALRCLRYEA